MPGRRAERLAEQIKEEISLIIAGEVEDPKVGFVTVTDAKLSDDLRNAKIYVSVLGSEDEIKHSLTALKHAAGFIRHQLGTAIRMKRTPDLHFVYDDTERNAARIEQLLTEEVVTTRETDSGSDESASVHADDPR